MTTYVSAPRVRRATPDTRRAAAFALTVAALTLLIGGTEVPTPLYVLYQHRFGFSDTVLSVVFAVYALALIPALIVGGRLADRIGHLPVVMAGLVLAAAGAAVLAAAANTETLVVGRAVQGIAVGTATGAATAALVELRAPGATRPAALWATLAVAGGGCLGPLVAGVLGQYAPAPRQLTYLVQIGLLAAVGVGLALVRRAFVSADPARRTRTGSAERPGVPAGLRTPFARVGLVVFAVWSVGGLYTALVPTYAGQLLATENLTVLGGVPFGMLAVAAATQLTVPRIGTRPAGIAGSVLVTAGVAALVVAFPTHSLILLVLSAVLDGVGLGLGFLGAQAGLQAITPPGRRAEMVGLFNVCLYLGVSVPVIGAGVVADLTSLFTAVVGFSALLAAVCVVAVTWTARMVDTTTPEADVTAR